MNGSLNRPPSLEDLRARRDEILVEQNSAFNVRVFGKVTASATALFTII